MRKVWIEAALNGAWSRQLQPGIPDTVEAIIAEGVACAPAPPSSTPTSPTTTFGSPISRRWSRAD
jgi:hypothetical protein